MSRAMMAVGRKTIFFQFVSFLKKNSGFQLLEEAKHTTLLLSTLYSIRKQLSIPEKNTFTWETAHKKRNTRLQSTISWILLY